MSQIVGGLGPGTEGSFLKSLIILEITLRSSELDGTRALICLTRRNLLTTYRTQRLVGKRLCSDSRNPCGEAIALELLLLVPALLWSPNTQLNCCGCSKGCRRGDSSVFLDLAWERLQVDPMARRVTIVNGHFERSWVHRFCVGCSM